MITSISKRDSRGFGIEDSVFFLGYIENPLRIIDELDILIASSSIDAFGRTIVEAMLLGTPVLAADKVATSSLLKVTTMGCSFRRTIERVYRKRASVIGRYQAPASFGYTRTILRVTRDSPTRKILRL